jgi:hypothetical protein
MFLDAFGMARVTLPVAPVHKVHKDVSGFYRRSKRCDVRGVGDESCTVRAHRFALFYSRFHSRFAPDFAPDSRSHSISLHRTRSGRMAHRFNANIVQGLTPSHSIPVSTDRSFQAKTEPSAQMSPRVRLPEVHPQPRSDQTLAPRCPGTAVAAPLADWLSAGSLRRAIRAIPTALQPVVEKPTWLSDHIVQ